MGKNIEKYLHKEMDKAAGYAHAQKKTKIVATVGPACESYEGLLNLVKVAQFLRRLLHSVNY